jgi:hypothetical protein
VTRHDELAQRFEARRGYLHGLAFKEALAYRRRFALDYLLIGGPC